VKPFDCVEVRFKTDEKSFTAILKTYFVMGDIVATVASPGHDIGIVTLTGELSCIQMKKKGVNPTSNEVAKYTEKHLKKILIFGQ
jgi:hypothetical protein